MNDRACLFRPYRVQLVRSKQTEVRMVDYRDVPGFPGYRVGSDGSSWTRRTRAGIRGPWRVLKQAKAGTYRNYRQIRLCTGKGKPVPVFVHHAVLWAFVGPRPEGMEAIHKNDIQDDNRADNLEWGTHKRNCQLRSANGKQSQGERRWNAKLTEVRVKWIRKNKNKMARAVMAKKLNVTVDTIRSVLVGITWKHVLEE